MPPALKRDAHGIVDGITAEDVGKFPDTNLAEAMQRISGVAIDREHGDGAKGFVEKIRTSVERTLAQLPAHADYVARYCERPVQPTKAMPAAA